MLVGLLAAVAVMATVSVARCADLILMSTVGTRSAMEELVPGFQAATGTHVRLVYDTAAGLQRQIKTGTQFDVVVLTRPLMAELTRDRIVRAEEQRLFASDHIGVAIAQGRTRPDISSRARLIAALLDADKISFAKKEASGEHFLRVVEQLNLTDALQDKLLPTADSREIEAVAAGQASLGVQLISEILPVKGVELVGPLPSIAQKVTGLKVGISAQSAMSKEAKRLIEFLTSHEAAEAVRRAGMLPP